MPSDSQNVLKTSDERVCQRVHKVSDGDPGFRAAEEGSDADGLTDGCFGVNVQICVLERAGTRVALTLAPPWACWDVHTLVSASKPKKDKPQESLCSVGVTILMLMNQSLWPGPSQKQQQGVICNMSLGHGA